ncbi:hypothetical protein [Nucisporomicrobium flavum]|uniref:hypothetical protein n=1 Tax=Nucisporomicrobium flavum TaxID=2785915 RepID=UPI0018F59A30|nr:hypothetical protein [Nucisporomicrobium flavum]
MVQVTIIMLALVGLAVLTALGVLPTRTRRSPHDTPPAATRPDGPDGVLAPTRPAPRPHLPAVAAAAGAGPIPVVTRSPARPESPERVNAVEEPRSRVSPAARRAAANSGAKRFDAARGMSAARLR